MRSRHLITPLSAIIICLSGLAEAQIAPTPAPKTDALISNLTPLTGSQLLTGQWVVERALICFRYDGALGNDISCFNVYKTGTCLYSFNPANIGPDGYPLDDNLWSVKTIARGDISSCDDLVS